MSRLLHVLNKEFDRLARTRLQWGERWVLSFHVCAILALGLGVPLVMGLTYVQGMELWVMACLVVVACSAVLLQMMVTKMLLGYERTTQLEHLIVILPVSVLLLTLLQKPVLPQLDIFTLGLGLFLGLGGMGCLMAGCCHGGPSPVGICYGPEHVAEGFPAYYVGVRLLPIQAIESCTVLSIVLVGVVMLLQPHNDGDVLWWFIVSHGVTRFLLEFLRGDPERPFFWGFSESQWLSLLLVAAVVAVETYARLPVRPGHVAAGAGLVLLTIIVGLRRLWWGKERYELLHPRHIRELLAAAERLHRQAIAGMVTGYNGILAEAIPVSTTSRGLTLSSSVLQSGGVSVHHYALSRRGTPLRAHSARTLAGLILGYQHPAQQGEIWHTEAGVTHCLVTRPGAASLPWTPATLARWPGNPSGA